MKSFMHAASLQCLTLAAVSLTSQCRYFCARRDWPPFMSTMMLLKYFTPMSIIWVCFFEMAAGVSTGTVQLAG